MLKRFLMFCIIFLIYGKKSLICAEDLILREKTVIICVLNVFLCVADLILKLHFVCSIQLKI